MKNKLLLIIKSLLISLPAFANESQVVAFSAFEVVLWLGSIALTVWIAIYLARGNRHLRRSQDERERLEQELKLANAQLEGKVEQRTRELQDSEARFRAMLESSPIAVRVADDGGRHVVFSNPRYLELINFAADVPRPIDPRDYYVRPEVYDETVRRLGAGAAVRDSLVELVIPGQGIKWVLASYFPFRFEGREAVLGWFYDITSLKQTERALQDSEARFRQMFERHASPMLLIDPASGELVNANQASAAYYGYSVAEMRQMNIGQINAQPPELIREQRQQAMQEKRNYFVFPHRLANGELRTVEIYSSPIEVEGRALLFSIVHDITERRELEVQMHNMAYYDLLTKLPNRRLLMDRLQHALVIAHRHQRHGALMFLDLDHFKLLNDLYGHEVGDQLLIEVARRLTSCIREQDSAARFGGDEFVVMLEGLDETQDEAATQAGHVAEKIRHALAQPYLLMSGGKTITHHCSSSIGVTLFGNRDETLEQLFKWTDMAMYHAKEDGRNTIRFFDPHMQTTVETRAALESDLHDALEQRQFELFYQIQVEENGQPIGAEVLLRWRHPQRGMVSPAQFIPLAEDTGLIVPIGAWVLETVCAQLAQWQQAGRHGGLVIAVNVSAKQFRQSDFVEQVRQCIARHAVPVSAIKLELTESLVLDNVEDTIAKMQQLQALGIRFSMDDFGTGYSSLSYLKRLPLDQVKIDQSFVRDLTVDKADLVMVKTIIGLGVNFGMDVIAEGVETRQQLELLKANGCHRYQGYLFSKPVPVKEFEALLAG